MLTGKIIVFIICAISAVLTFRGEWVIKTFSKNESTSEKQIMRLKYTALGLAVAAFVAVLLTQ